MFASENLPYAVGRYEREVLRLFSVLDKGLTEHDHLVGDYGIADIATWLWVNAYTHLALSLDAHPHLKRWHAVIKERPAVKKGLAVPQLNH